MPAELLPLVIPLSRIPVIGLPLARALDPPLRVLVEAGYDRTINPGQPTPAKYLYFPNPIKTLIDFAVAIPTGWDDAISSITGNPADRPFRTAPQPIYGVGGPPVYSGAVDPYGPVDPSVAVAVADAMPAAAESEENRTEVSLAAPTATFGQRMKASGDVPSSASANRPRAAALGRVRAERSREVAAESVKATGPLRQGSVSSMPRSKR
jgi:hypothetical protein